MAADVREEYRREAVRVDEYVNALREVFREQRALISEWRTNPSDDLLRRISELNVKRQSFARRLVYSVECSAC